MNEHILVVEDDQLLRESLEVRLRAEGYTVDTAMDGNEALQKATELPFDLIILDVMLPYRTGLDVCRSVRQQGLATPILMLTVRDQVVDKVVGFTVGADDYLTKPYDALELIARIEALLRRTPVRAGQGVHRFGSIQVDVPRRKVTRNQKAVHLTSSEFRVLCYLIERAGSSISRRELLHSIWGYEDGTYTRTVDMHVATLRQKLEFKPKEPEMILTVSGVGYKFVAPAHK